MPIIQQNPAWANILSGLVGAYGVQQGMKRRKQQDERQKQIDAQNAAVAQANIDYEKANAQHMQAQTQIDQADIGLRKQDLDLRRQIEQDRHNRELQDQLRKNKDESLKFQEFLEKKLQDKATRQHLGTMDQASMARISIEVARLQNEVRKGNISAEQAQERIGIEEGNLGLRTREEGMREKEFGLKKQEFQFRKDQAKAKPSKTNPSKGLEKLPGAVQQTIIKMRKEGVSDQGIIEAVKSSQMPDDVKALTIKALGGSP